MDNNTFAQNSAPPEHALHKWIADAYNNCTGSFTKKTDQCGNDFANDACEFAKTAALFTPGAAGRVATAALYAADEVDLRDGKHTAYDIACGALKGAALRLVNDAGFSSEAHPLIQGATLGLASRVCDVTFTRSTYQRPGQNRFDAWYGLQNMSAELTNRPAMLTDVATFAAASAMSRIIPVSANPICSHLGATISGATFGFMGGAVQEADNQWNQGRRGNALNWTAIARSGLTRAALDAGAASLGHGLGRRAPSELCPRAPKAPGTFPESSFDGTSRSALGKGTGDTPRWDSCSLPMHKTPEAELPPTNGVNPVYDGYHRQERQLLSKLGDDLDSYQSAELFDALAGIDRRNCAGELHHDTIKQIYRQTETLLEADALIPEVRGAGPLLAKQIIMQVANPHLVQQGNHPTCTVAALEHRLFKKDPEKATDVIVQAVTKATYKPPYAYNGKEITVKLDPQSMIAEHTCIDPYGEGGKYRSYASHILQYVTPNVHWQAQDPNLRYERATKAREFTIRDFGKQKSPLLHDYPHLGSGETTSIYEAITGNGTRCHYSGNSFRSQRDFKEKLVDAKQQQQLPLILSVDVRHSPFYEHVGEGTRQALSDTDHTHDICVTGFNPKNGMVSVYNSWGRQFHQSGIPLDTLYKALERSR